MNKETCRHKAAVLLVPALALAFLSGCGRQPEVPEEAPPAGLAVEPQEIDLGRVFLGTAPRFKAELVNNGTSEAELKEITASCGCTSASADKKCPAGGRIELTGRLRPVSELGPFRHQVVIIQADHEDQPLVLDLIGTVEAQIQVSEQAIALRPDCLAGKAGEAAFGIKNASAATIHLQKPVGLPAGITAVLDRMELKPGDEARVTVRALPDQLTDTDFEVRVPTSHPRENTVAVRVALRPEGGLTLTPRAIRLGVVRRKRLLEGKGFTLKLAGRALAGLAVEDIKLPPYLRLSERERQGPEGVRLRFAFVDSFAGMELNDAIRLDFQAREEQRGRPSRQFSIGVPITGMVSAD